MEGPRAAWDTNGCDCAELSDSLLRCARSALHSPSSKQYAPSDKSAEMSLSDSGPAQSDCLQPMASSASSRSGPASETRRRGFRGRGTRAGKERARRRWAEPGRGRCSGVPVVAESFLRPTCGARSSSPVVCRLDKGVLIDPGSRAPQHAYILWTSTRPRASLRNGQIEWEVYI